MLDKLFGIVRLLAALLTHYASYRAGRSSAQQETHEAAQQNQTTRALVAADISRLPDATVLERLRARWMRQ